MEKLKIAVGRFVMGLNRYSKTVNERRLRKRSESIASVTIREAIIDDIPELAALHVKAWAETYWNVKRPPTFEIREYQWREQFKITDGSWFCFLAQNKEGKIIGFAKANTYNHADLPDYAGQLNKIYLLREYQRLGVGRRLIGHVAARFISQKINSMVLFSEVNNPSG